MSAPAVSLGYVILYVNDVAAVLAFASLALAEAHSKTEVVAASVDGRPLRRAISLSCARLSRDRKLARNLAGALGVQGQVLM